MIEILKSAFSAVTGALGGIWGYAAAFAAGGLILGWAAVSVAALSYKATISDLKAEYATTSALNANAALAQFAADAGQVHAAAILYSQQQADTNAHFTAIEKDFHNAIMAKPLPPGCAPTPERRHVLDNAVDAANATRAAGQ
jgi:hypothetical protein